MNLLGTGRKDEEERTDQDRQPEPGVAVEAEPLAVENVTVYIDRLKLHLSLGPGMKEIVDLDLEADSAMVQIGGLDADLDLRVRLAQLLKNLLSK